VYSDCFFAIFGRITSLQNIALGTVSLSFTPPTIELDQLCILISKVATGDNEALRALYTGTSSKLYGDAFRILKKHELVEDVLQETYIAIWRNAISYQRNLSAPMTWMRTILRNKAFDLLRTIIYTIEIDADNFDESLLIGSVENNLGPLEALESSRLTYALVTCMGQLNIAHRQVVYMAFYDECRMAK
jgi:RNA polymerase sigma factor (sigma-70 family)